MKHALAIGLLVSLLASHAFALPSAEPMHLLGELRDSQQQPLP